MHRIESLAAENLGATLSSSDTNAFLSSLMPGSQSASFDRLVQASRIMRRQSLAPYGQLKNLQTIEERNALYMSHAPEAGRAAAQKALDQAHIQPDQVDVLIVSSSTGFAVPTLDQHIATHLGLKPDVRSLYLPGLGCAGALRGIGLASDLLSASSGGDRALVVSVELCSPWLQVAEPSPEDIRSNVMFGDGAGAVVVGPAGPGCGGVEVVARRSALWPDSLTARGATLTQSGFRHFVSPALPRILRWHLGKAVNTFLSKHGVCPSDLAFYVVNPSDHRVLDTIARILEVSDEQMRPAWDVWENRGNTLSAGPLYVLDALQRLTPPTPGDLGLALVMGPGLTVDLMLLRWCGAMLN